MSQYSQLTGEIFVFKNVHIPVEDKLKIWILLGISEIIFEDVAGYCSYLTSHCLISMWLPVCVQAYMWLFGREALVSVCVHVCLWWVVNEADVFALLEECVVSEGPISPQPRAWLQALGRTASTDEFVSVIKVHSAACAGTRQTHTRRKHTCSLIHTLLEMASFRVPRHIDSQTSLVQHSVLL